MNMESSEFIYCYKYLPFNNGSRKIICDGTIKYSSPLDFNDPFDCRPIYCKVNRDDIELSRPDLIKEVGRRRNWSPAKIIKNRKKISAEISNFVSSEEYIDEKLAQLGVLCLTTDPKNILMWSHYADCHKGFVIAFRIPRFGYKEEAGSQERI